MRFWFGKEADQIPSPAGLIHSVIYLCTSALLTYSAYIPSGPVKLEYTRSTTQTVAPTAAAGESNHSAVPMKRIITASERTVLAPCNLAAVLLFLGSTEGTASLLFAESVQNVAFCVLEHAGVVLSKG